MMASEAWVTKLADTELRDYKSPEIENEENVGHSDARIVWQVIGSSSYLDCPFK